MKKWKEQIMQMDFKHLLKRFVVLALIFAVLGGIAAGFTLRQQIGEVISYVRTEQENDHPYDENEVSGWPEYGQYFLEEHGHQDFESLISEPSAAAELVLGFITLLGFLLVAFYWLMVAAWMYQAAIGSDMNGLFWFLVGLGGNLLSAVAFLVVRSFLREKCLACGQWQRRAPFCHHCGTAMGEVCPACGEKCAANEAFCHNCGQRMMGRANESKGRN